MLSIAQEICPKAKAIIAIGNCASDGGLPAAAPNPTGAAGVQDALGSGLAVPVVNLPGCPPNPVNFVGVVANYLLQGTLPSLDADGRPTFAYGKEVHGQCPYREDNARCLFEAGCKGKETFNNCPSIKLNDGTSFPMQVGHPCIGCSEPDFWDTMTPFYRKS
jgi:[NiFe] hydrogenase small subunit